MISANLPVPAADGVGTSVDVSTLGPERTFSIDAITAFSGIVIVEASTNNVNFVSIGRFDASSQRQFNLLLACNFLRIRRIGSNSVGAPVVTVGAQPAGDAVFGTLNTPAGNGVGAAFDISGGGEIITVLAAGFFDRLALIEGSQDGGVSFGRIEDFGALGTDLFKTVLSNCNQLRVRSLQTNQDAPVLMFGSMTRSVGASNAAGVANWPPTLVRFYFVDNENGDDSATGFIDAVENTVFTPAQTGPVALRTLEELYTRLPRFGAARRAVVLLKARADGGIYQNKSGAPDIIDRNHTGYIRGPIQRGSDLTNSVNDKIDVVCINDPAALGPNGDGSWTIAGAMAGFTMTVAAGILPAQDVFTGLKMQFAGNVTASARTLGNVPVKRLTDTTFEVGSTMTVAAGDTFTFRRPGLIVGGVVGEVFPISSDDPSFVRGAPLVGVEIIEGDGVFDATWHADNQLQVVRFANTLNLRMIGGLAVGGVWRDESNTSRSTRCGIDARGGAFFGFGAVGQQAAPSQVFNSAFHGPVTFGPLGNQLQFGASCFFGGVVTFRGVPLSGNALGGLQAGIMFGSPTAGNRAAVITAGVVLESCSLLLNRIDLAGSTGGFTVLGQYNHILFENVVGPASVPTVLDFSAAAQGSRFIFGTGNTATGTVQDILMAGGVAKSFASLAADHWIDSQNNQYMGTAGIFVTRLTAGSIARVPILGADPAVLVNGDIWITDIGAVRNFCARIGGVTYRSVMV